MKGNRFFYYIREGINSIFNHGFMSFASVCIIVACLIIMGSFTLLALNVDAIIDTMESQNEILALVNDSFNEEQARAIGMLIERIPNVSQAVYVSRDEAWEDFLETYNDNSGRFEGLDSDIIPDRYEVFLDDISLMEQTQKDIAEVAGITDVMAPLTIMRGFVRIRNIVTIISVVLVAMLFLISLFIMSNTIKLTTFERRDEIAIMKMVGATSLFIRWPFVVQGLILGLIGSMVSFLLEWGVYQLLVGKLISGSGFAFMTFLPFSQVAIPLLAAFTAVGLGVGIIGSLLAIKNYLKV